MLVGTALPRVEGKRREGKVGARRRSGRRDGAQAETCAPYRPASGWRGVGRGGRSESGIAPERMSERWIASIGSRLRWAYCVWG